MIFIWMLNFQTLNYLILFRKFKKALQMEEVRAYFAIIFVATAIITGSLVGGNMQFFDALRHAAFQVGSINYNNRICNRQILMPGRRLAGQFLSF